MSVDWPLRAVTAPGGSVLLDLDDGASFAWLADSFTVSPLDSSSSTGQQTAAVQTQIDERYGGLRTDYEQRSNGTLSWSAFVRGSSSASLDANIAALIAVVESAAPMFIERADPGFSGSLFYERRGPGTWVQTMLDPYQFMATVDVAFPIAPAARGLPFTTSQTIAVPGRVVLGAIPGNIPALVDVALDLPATPFAWGLVAPWVPAGAPLGVIGATGLGLTNLALATDAGATSGRSAQAASIVAGTFYTVNASFDPSTVTLDGFERDVAVEVWARCKYNAATMVGGLLALAGAPPAGIGAPRQAVDAPFGQPIGDAAAGTIWRVHRAGILRLPVEPGSGQWTVSVAIIPGAGSSGTLAIDYLALVPARHRAVSPTGVSPASGYPRLLATNAVAQTKTIKHDGHGLVSLIGGTGHSDTGLGGSLLTVMPGPSAAVMLHASPAVPDDPTATAGNDTITTAVPVRVTVTPRFSLWSAP